MKISNEQISNVLSQEAIKREVIEGDKFEAAKKKISRSANRSLRAAREATPVAVQENARC